MRVRGKLAGAAALSAAVALVGCGSSSTSSSSRGAAPSKPHGGVSVLYAGSLEDTIEHDLGPAFTRADGYSFQGVGAGSTELVAQIKSGVRQGDVFISASPKANAGLEGAGNGSWETWHITFAKSPLVLGYSPSSRFAAQFRTKPWYEVITRPGIRVGRTDPKLDPKGKLTVEALTAAAGTLHMPALTRALAGFPVFPEESLVGRLESGQLDAGFFYSSEAKEQHIQTVSLAPIAKSATYTVTILKDAPNFGGARAFLSFLLSGSGRAILTRHGLILLRPKLIGSSSALPAQLRTFVGG